MRRVRRSDARIPLFGVPEEDEDEDEDDAGEICNFQFSLADGTKTISRMLLRLQKRSVAFVIRSVYVRWTWVWDLSR